MSSYTVTRGGRVLTEDVTYMLAEEPQAKRLKLASLSSIAIDIPEGNHGDTLIGLPGLESQLGVFEAAKDHLVSDAYIARSDVVVASTEKHLVNGDVGLSMDNGHKSNLPLIQTKYVRLPLMLVGVML